MRHGLGKRIRILLCCVVMEVAIEEMNELDCQNVSAARAPAPSYHHFDIANKEFLVGVVMLHTHAYAVPL